MHGLQYPWILIEFATLSLEFFFQDFPFVTCDQNVTVLSDTVTLVAKTINNYYWLILNFKESEVKHNKIQENRTQESLFHHVLSAKCQCFNFYYFNLNSNLIVIAHSCREILINRRTWKICRATKLKWFKELIV